MVILATAGLACGWALAQKIDDTPPAVQNNVPPNFMFMVDNSGSMQHVVVAAPYSSTLSIACSGANLTLAAGTSVDLRVTSNVPRIYVTSGPQAGVTYRHVTMANTPSNQSLCFNNSLTYEARLFAGSTSGSVRVPPGTFLPAEYTGHYLNWYFGNYFSHPVTWPADRKPLLGGGNVDTRIMVARSASKAAIASLPLPASTTSRAAVRVGLSTYRADFKGGQLLNGMADLNSTYRGTLNTTIDALTPAIYTPLATTFADIARYMATGYNGSVVTANTPAPGVNIDTLLRMDTDAGSRNACLLNSPVACNSTTATAAQKPIQYWCQRTSLFAVTDGRPTQDRGFVNNTYVRDYDRDCSGINASSCGSYDRKNNRDYELAESSDYMDDVAKLMFDVDWRPDLTKPTPIGTAEKARNNIVTYMIGFADKFVQNDPLLISTAHQGGGRFIAAEDGPGLVNAFKSVIADALAKDAAAAAVAVTNAQITAGSIGYASSYNSGSWYGDLEAYSLDLTTGLQNGGVQWSFRDRLQSQVTLSGHTSRKIVTYSGNAASPGMAFTTANGGNFRGSTPLLTDPIINYTRGDPTDEGSTLRDRNYVLGDIINAEPVVVNYSASTATVFQAANDGMLHVIDGRIDTTIPTRGQELWAYLPRLAHSKLVGRASEPFQHQFLVDGTPAVGDITGFTPTKILVGGLAKGGAGYYALDISSATAPTTEAAAATHVLWEVAPANMGYSFGTPLIVNTADGWRVVVASGYGNDSAGIGGNGRGYVYVLNPGTGAVVKKFQTPATVLGLVGLAHLGKPAGSPGATVRYVYGGDLQGNVWRVDLDATDGADLTRIAIVTDGASTPRTQPITVTPVVQALPGSTSKNIIYFGTGMYFSLDDVPGTGAANVYANQTQTFYGIVDDTSLASPGLPNIRGSNGYVCPPGGLNALSNFVCQTLTQSGGNFQATHNPVDFTSKRGFYVDIPSALIPGGRVNTQAALTSGGTLVVVVNKPTDIVCNPGGSSYFFQLSALTGGAIQKTYGGTDYFDAGYALADALSSRPLVVVTADGPRAIFRLSDKTTQSKKIDETAGSAPAFRRVYMRPLN
jgi:type IV pilus assembly protein PilY1